MDSIEAVSKLLKQQESQLGASNPQLAVIVSRLADLHFLQRDFAQAEPLYWRALRIRQQSLGDLHPDTADSLQDLGELYEIQDRYAEAQRFYKWAIRVRKASMVKADDSDMEVTAIMHVTPKLPQLTQLEEATCTKCRRKLLDSTVCLYCTQGGFDAMQYLRSVAQHQRAGELTDKRPANMLRSQDGEDQYRLNDHDLTIGRHPSNGVYIPDDNSVSRYHAKVFCTGGEFFISDNGSANGTFVNGEKIEKNTRLVNGDVISIGNKSILAIYQPD